MEVGTMVVVAAFLLGLSFNAGIQFNRITNVENRTSILESQFAALTSAETPTQVRLTRIETILQEIQQEQKQEQQALRQSGVTSR